MAMITITIDMDNAAFDEAPASELSKVIYEIADEIQAGRLPPFKGEDDNGNVIAYVTDDEMGRAIPDRITCAACGVQGDSPACTKHPVVNTG